jgi:hypothetical protein
MEQDATMQYCLSSFYTTFVRNAATDISDMRALALLPLSEIVFVLWVHFTSLLVRVRGKAVPVLN